MKKKMKKEKEDKKIVKLFLPILDLELSLASKILKIPFKVAKRCPAYEKIRQRNRNAAFGLIKSKEDLNA